MNPADILQAATTFTLVVLSLALAMTVVRIIRGPSLADRVLGLDMLVAIAIGFIATIAVRTGFNLYIDIAIALGLVGFLATVAFARFILARGLSSEKSEVTPHLRLPKGGKARQAARRKRRGER
ncbi:cation:proton antiporter [Rhizobium sp. 32-5/1]|uniref:cation:proton antiporter n=1 Tax=Rhizobium sp. 32-5/1 TaxID=3019602 RepID=UPI00240E1796|nr:cation:proton antiporter [Rhizobium sp. 32-5/1]WEZ84012.1 cation:proton antiporter [Rhizobium sp. 32-5/1]